MEGKLVGRAVLSLAEKDKIKPETLQLLRDNLSLLERAFDGLGFCLSQEGDLLSQWRGYAGDATGVAIGFPSDYLMELSRRSRTRPMGGFGLHRVEYNSTQHEELVRPTYQKMRGIIDSGALDRLGFRGMLDTRTDAEIEEDRRKVEEAYGLVTMEALSLFPQLFLLKALAFSEEREWRLISVMITGGYDKSYLYRAVNSRIVPYRVFPLEELDVPPIAEVILGPKHPTPSSVVSDFLRRHDFDNVSVRRSAATYR